jgi:NAD(P)-dependent dehydrogenase (short-subunit alcohol dehydrogenase family)
MVSDKKIALVREAASGIGRAIALGLANHGADVVVNYRSREDAAEEVAEKTRGMGKQALLLKADVANEKLMKAVVDRVVDEFGVVDRNRKTQPSSCKR